MSDVMDVKAPRAAAVSALNVLTDPWIPLQGGLASFVELITGEKDAPDLEHPRDEMKFFMRMLLSALAQALFPVRDVQALRARIKTPMLRAEVDGVVSEFGSDFEVLGPGAFMQGNWSNGSPAEQDNETARLFLDIPAGTKHTLFRPAATGRGPNSWQPVALCASCTTGALYGGQAFAPSDGKGYSPGVRGSPPTSILLNAPTSVRASIWFNVLHAQRASAFPKAGERPWAAPVAQKAGEAISLAEGLFWKPRVLKVSRAAEGLCSCCGASAALRFKVAGRVKGAKVAGGYFVHPLTPRIKNAKGEMAPLHLKGERPAWFGLVDCLGTVSSAQQKEIARAEVLTQCIEDIEPELHGVPVPHLLVLDFQTDKAKVKGRVVQMHPLRLSVRGDAAVQDLGHCCYLAEQCAAMLGRALKQASPHSAKGGFSAGDASSEFWAATELAFHELMPVLQSDADDTAVKSALADFQRTLRRSTLQLFDDHTSLALSDPLRQQSIAKAKSWLGNNISKIGSSA